MVKNAKYYAKYAKYVNEEVAVYGVEARKHEGIAKRWIVITIFCLIVALYGNFYFYFNIIKEFESIEILKIVPINVISLVAISLSAGLARFHNVIAEKRNVEALKFLNSPYIDADKTSITKKSKKAGSSKLRPSPARR